jgi:hypothetical protein
MSEREWSVNARVFGGALAAFLSACASASGPAVDAPSVLLETSRNRYGIEIHSSRPELVIPYRLENHLDVVISVAACARSVSVLFERRVDGQWRTTNLPRGNNCDAGVRSLSPAEVVHDTVSVLWRTVGEDGDPQTFRYRAVGGEYRLRVSTVSGAGDPSGGLALPIGLAVSNVFEVFEPPGTPSRVQVRP